MDEIFTLILIVGIIGIVVLFSFYLFKTYVMPKKVDELAHMIESGQVVLAIKKLQTLVEEDDHNPYLHFLLGEAYMKTGQLQEAQMEYKAALKYIVKDTSKVKEETVRSRLARLFMQTRNFNEAKKEFLILTKINPSDPENFYQVGMLFEKAGLSEKALPYFQQAAKINPSHGDSQYYIGVINYNFKNIRDAKAALTEAVRINPKNHGAHYHLGQCLRNQKELDWAIKEFDAASKDEGWYPRALLGKSLCFFEKEQYRKVITTLEGVIDSVTNMDVKLNMYYYISIAAEKLRDFNIAINYWEKIVDINPKFRDVKEKLSTYEEFRTHDSIKDFMIASPGKFEKICRDLVEKDGYSVSDLQVVNDSQVMIIATDSPGQGALRATKSPTTIFMIYRTTDPIAEKELRQVHELMKSRNITRGACYTTSEYSTQAEIFCQSRPIELFDRKAMVDKLRGIV